MTSSHPEYKCKPLQRRYGGEHRGGFHGARKAIVSAVIEAAKPQQHVVPDPNKKSAQFQYMSKCDDPSMVQHFFECTLVAPANILVGELLSLSPDY